MAGRERDVGVLRGRGASALLCPLLLCSPLISPSPFAAQAKALLTQNYANARSSLEAVKRDVLSLRDSITTTEVSIARIFNEDVKRRRALGGK